MILRFSNFLFFCGAPRSQPRIFPQLCLFRPCWISDLTVSVCVFLFLFLSDLLIFELLSLCLLPLLFHLCHLLYHVQRRDIYIDRAESWQFCVKRSSGFAIFVSCWRAWAFCWIWAFGTIPTSHYYSWANIYFYFFSAWPSIASVICAYLQHSKCRFICLRMHYDALTSPFESSHSWATIVMYV